MLNVLRQSADGSMQLLDKSTAVNCLVYLNVLFLFFENVLLDILENNFLIYKQNLILAQYFLVLENRLVLFMLFENGFFILNLNFQF